MACSNTPLDLSGITECRTSPAAANLVAAPRHYQGREQISGFQAHEDGYSITLGPYTYFTYGTPPAWVKNGAIVDYKSTPETGLMMILLWPAPDLVMSTAKQEAKTFIYCPTCDGTGRSIIPGKPCPQCLGAGMIEHKPQGILEFIAAEKIDHAAETCDKCGKNPA